LVEHVSVDHRRATRRPARGIEEEERRECLVLRGGADLRLDGQKRQETRYFGGAHLGGMTLAVKEDEATDPPDVSALRAPAVVTQAEGERALRVKLEEY
jgi:hypothetical protein